MPDTTYTTSQGETWDVIAKKLWGSEKLAHRLVQANPAHVRTVFFSGGTVLSVPSGVTAAAALPLPPWRRT